MAHQHSDDIVPELAVGNVVVEALWRFATAPNPLHIDARRRRELALHRKHILGVVENGLSSARRGLAILVVELVLLDRLLLFLLWFSDSHSLSRARSPPRARIKTRR